MFDCVQALKATGAGVSIAVSIAGATGHRKEIVNGSYVKSTEVKNGKPVYAKVGDKTKCLFYAADDKWSVANVATKEKNGTKCFAYTPTTFLASPVLEPAGWRVAEKDSGGKTVFQDQIDVTVKAIAKTVTAVLSVECMPDRCVPDDFETCLRVYACVCDWPG